MSGFAILTALFSARPLEFNTSHSYSTTQMAAQTAEEFPIFLCHHNWRQKYAFLLKVERIAFQSTFFILCK